VAAAEPRRFVLLMALAVGDEEGYARYRERMLPILAAHGGAFGCDFRVGEVLKGADARVNRVFTLSFPDRNHRERFFADEGYQRIRGEHFAPSVIAASVLGEYEECGAR
jgi:uncharacterized protein (DUF1330 family)